MIVYGDGSNKRRLGNIYVGKGKCIIKLPEVLIPGIKTRFSFEATSDDLFHNRKSFDKRNALLNTKLQQDILWYTNSISVISQGVEKGT